MWSAFRDPSPHYFAHIELIPKVRSHLGNMIWGGSANLTAKKNGCKYIYSYIYIHAHTHIFWEPIINQCGCWPTDIFVDPSPLISPIWLLKPPISLLAESKNCPISHEGLTLRFGVPKSGVPRAVTADDAWTYQAVQLIVPQHGGRGASAEMVSQLAGPVSCD